MREDYSERFVMFQNKVCQELLDIQYSILIKTPYVELHNQISMVLEAIMLDDRYLIPTKPNPCTQ